MLFWYIMLSVLWSVSLLLFQRNQTWHTCTHAHTCFMSQPLPPSSRRGYIDSEMRSTQSSNFHCGFLSVFTTNGPWGFLQDYPGLSSKRFAFWLWFQHYSISWPWKKIFSKFPLHKAGIVINKCFLLTTSNPEHLLVLGRIQWYFWETLYLGLSLVNVLKFRSYVFFLL